MTKTLKYNAKIAPNLPIKNQQVSPASAALVRPRPAAAGPAPTPPGVPPARYPWGVAPTPITILAKGRLS